MSAKNSGNNYDTSGSWEITRNSQRYIDSNGLDDLLTLPIEKSYGCQLRDQNVHLYFHKKGKTWTNAFAEFIHKVNEIN